MGSEIKKLNGPGKSAAAKRYQFVRVKTASEIRKALKLKSAQAYKIHHYLSLSNGGRILSDRDINRAVRTVRIRNAGNRWIVKKVANPKVWSFQHSDTALAKAVNLAKPESWSVVVHDKSGRITKVIAPSQFDKLTLDVKPGRLKAGQARRRQNQPHQVATPQPA